MSVSRRRLFTALAIAAGGSTTAEAADAPTIDALRNVSSVQGTNLTDDRLRVLQPVLERRLRQLQRLRDFQFDDTVEPTQGILSK